MCVLAIARGRQCTNDVPNNSASCGRTSSPVEPKVVGEAVPVIQPNRPHAGSGSLSLQWSAAGAGAAASYMKKPLFHVAVLAPSAHQFLSNVSAQHTVVSPQVSRLSVLLSQSKVSAQHVVVSPQVSRLSVLLSQSKVSAQHVVVSHQASRLSVPPSQSKVSVQHAVVDCIVVFAYDNYYGQSFTVLYSAFFQGHNINFANIS